MLMVNFDSSIIKFKQDLVDKGFYKLKTCKKADESSFNKYLHQIGALSNAKNIVSSFEADDGESNGVDERLKVRSYSQTDDNVDISLPRLLSYVPNDAKPLSKLGRSK